MKMYSISQMMEMSGQLPTIKNFSLFSKMFSAGSVFGKKIIMINIAYRKQSKENFVCKY